MIYKYHLTTGEVRDIDTHEPLSLERLQKLVGGYIERVWEGEPYHSNCLMVNEEGQLLGLPQNPSFPQFVGNIVVGKCIRGEDGDEFVGF